MITADGPEAYGYTIFCDDIRVELGNKLTYVGVYGGQLVAHGTFPFVLPKLAFSIVYMQKRDAFVLPIKFWIFFPGDPDDAASFQAEAPVESTQQAMAAAAAARPPEERGYGVTYVHFGMTNLTIPQPGVIKVRAVRGDELIRLGSLEVTQAPGPEAQHPPVLPPQP